MVHTRITAGFYFDPKQVIHALQESLYSKWENAIETEDIVNMRTNAGVIFDFNEHTQVVRIQDGLDFFLDLTPHLARVLGFKAGKITKPGIHYGRLIVDLDTINTMYVNCDIVQARIVNVSIRYNKLHHQPISKRNFSQFLFPCVTTKTI